MVDANERLISEHVNMSHNAEDGVGCASPGIGEKENKKQRLLTAHSRCMHYFTRKKRYCGMQRKNGHLYCGLHIEEQRCSDTLERVQCPYGNHTVWKRVLKKHIKTCPEFLLKIKLESEPYYEQGVNRSQDRDAVALPRATDIFGKEKDTISNRRLSAILRMGEEEFGRLIDKIEKIWSRLGCHNGGGSQSPHKCTNAAGDKIVESERHHAQQASIFKHMNDLGFFQDSSAATYIEFGSGKGYLTSTFVDLVSPKSLHRIILLDRKTFKKKADTCLRKNNITRLRCDISDFNPSKLEGMDKKSQWVAYGKHLCGAATDFTIRCVANQLKSKGTVPLGFAIASCCHYLTSWDQCVGSEVLESQGMTPEEFEIMCYMSGWSTCGHNHIDDSGRCQMEQQQQEQSLDSNNRWKPHMTISRSRRVELGTKCKDVIDMSRVLYFSGLDGVKLAKKVAHVDPTISIENRLLLGVIELT